MRSGGHGISIRDGWFVDAARRHLLLRGLNLGGDSKLPAGVRTDQPAAWTPGFQPFTFVGRPFPLESADEHLARIRGWGFNVVRLVITWEAVEHRAPGVYDERYLDYLHGLVAKAAEHDLMVFVDPHQDVWSRFTGGDGAPLWTFDLAGLDAEVFRDTGAVQLNSFDWFHNYQTVPVATMWTLFWAGDSYCPELRGVQSELQGRYMAMLSTVAERLADLNNVLGYDSCNEPSGGYIGRGHDLVTPAMHFVGDGKGPRPWSALEYLAAADGISIVGEDGRILNASRRSIWRRGCPWRRAGVWALNRDGRPRLGNGEHFIRFKDRPVDLWSDCMAPFFRRLHTALRTRDPDCILFVEPPPHYLRNSATESGLPECDARHWYDLPTLSTRRLNPKAYRTRQGSVISGEDELAQQFADEIGRLKQWSRRHMGDAPLLIGEFGLPYDINGKSAYADGDYSCHMTALDAYYRAIEINLVSSTQWNYSASNTHAHGDGWNFEDLSVWSSDDADPSRLICGGRGEAAFSRPYARRCAGRPLQMKFDRHSGTFDLEIEPDETIDAPTEVFVPSRHYGVGASFDVSSGRVTYSERDQIALWSGASGPRATMRMQPRD